MKLARRMKVAVDCGNGVAGPLAARLFEGLGADIEPLYFEIDGNFPHHHPDPSKPANLNDLIRAVQAGDAELGLAFDGDADRLGVVTRSGNIIYPDRQMMLLPKTSSSTILVLRSFTTSSARALWCPGFENEAAFLRSAQRVIRL